MKQYMMGIDNGGSYVKAAIFDREGHQIALEKIFSPAYQEKKQYSERDQDELWQNNCRCIRSLLEKSGILPEEIACVAFAGQGKGLYCTDSNGESICRAVTSADLRSTEMLQKWKADGTQERLFPIVCQEVKECHTLAVLAWEKMHRPETYYDIRWVFTMKDYLNFRMTGQACSDYCSQSGSPFLNFQTLEYDKEILRQAGVEEVFEKLPPLKWPHELCGHVTDEASRQSGLSAGTPVAVGMFDVNASMLAMGVISENMLCMITGTWSINTFLSQKPVMDHSVMYNSVYFVPGYYLIEEGSPTSAGVLEWAIEALFGENRKKLPDDIYEVVNELVDSVSPEETDTVFQPYVHGNILGDQIGGSWIHLTAGTGRAHLLRAVYEGVAFAHRIHVERLKKNMDRAEKVRMAGGAVCSEQWVQIFADILQCPLEIMQNKELGAQGAALCAGIAAGIYRDYKDAVEQTVKIRKTVDPRPQYREIYEKKYELYRKQ